MKDGSPKDLRTNDAYIIPPGHDDAWILGDEPCVVIEFVDMTTTPNLKLDAV